MSLMLSRLLFLRFLAVVLTAFMGIVWGSLPAQAASADAFVRRYLDAEEPVPLVVDAQGQTQPFSTANLSQGKRLFEESCKNCHVGGATLPDPTVPLSLKALQGAVPPRDNINALVAFLRDPMTYDGSEESYVCRQVSERWMSQTQVENLSAFILRSAQKAPGWGSSSF